MPRQSSGRIDDSNNAGTTDLTGTVPAGTKPAEMLIGLKIRELRNQRGYSLRTLADRSGLNINTLSLVEKGKCSPSIGTLQLLARALEVHITAFFESEPVSTRVVFTSHKHRPEATLYNTHMQNLGKDLAGSAVQPFIVTLEPGAGSGDRMLVHAGHEFVYCLRGKVLYVINEIVYILAPGDSVVFESDLPHQWKNIDENQSQFILILYPAGQPGEPGGNLSIHDGHSEV
jgi:transcriptional regulator with XRE-family HTH domain